MQLEKYEKRSKHNVSDPTLKSRMSALRTFSKFVGGKEPDADDVERWIDHMIDKYESNEVKASTIDQYFNAIRYYFETVKGGSDEIDHMKKWLPDKNIDHGDYLTEEEWDKFIDSIYDYRDRSIFMLMYEYARRPGEIRLLNQEDLGYDDEKEEETITFTILKKRRETNDGKFRATFNLKDNCKRAIDAYLDKYESKNFEETDVVDGEEVTVHPLFTTTHGRISYDSIWRKSKKYARSANINPEKNIMPKTMRHTRATHLDWAGFSPDEIARHQLVHGPNTNVISAYIHDRDESQVREVMNIEDKQEE